MWLNDRFWMSLPRIKSLRSLCISVYVCKITMIRPEDNNETCFRLVLRHHIWIRQWSRRKLMNSLLLWSTANIFENHKLVLQNEKIRVRFFDSQRSIYSLPGEVISEKTELVFEARNVDQNIRLGCFGTPNYFRSTLRLVMGFLKLRRYLPDSLNFGDLFINGFENRNRFAETVSLIAGLVRRDGTGGFPRV